MVYVYYRGPEDDGKYRCCVGAFDRQPGEGIAGSSDAPIATSFKVTVPPRLRDRTAIFRRLRESMGVISENNADLAALTLEQANMNMQCMQVSLKEFLNA